MRKAISELVVVVMLLMISIVVVGVAYSFFMDLYGQTKSETQQSGTESFKRIGSCLQTVSFDDKTNNLYVKNCGRYAIENVTVFIDSKLSGAVSINAKPNEIKNITISAAAGIHEVKIVSDYVSITVSVDIGSGTIIILDITFLVKNSLGNNIASFGSSGNITLKGTCAAAAGCAPPANAPFVVQNPAGSAVSYIDDSGNLCVQDANCNDKDANCSNPGDGSFIIQNSGGVNVAYINSAGNLCLSGTLTQNGIP